MLLVAVVDQGIEAVDAFDDDIAAAPAVAAARPAFRAKGLAQKRNASFAAVTGARVDFDLINKHSGKNVTEPRA